jgi:hypothetical protein
MENFVIFAIVQIVITISTMRKTDKRRLSLFWKEILEHFDLKLERVLRRVKHMRGGITKGAIVAALVV